MCVCVCVCVCGHEKVYALLMLVTSHSDLACNATNCCTSHT